MAFGLGLGLLGAQRRRASAVIPPNVFTLTDVASGRLFQRTKALTTGPVTASGTYSGGTPSSVQLQVLKVSDNSVVADWTTASAAIGGGAWTATITGVAQGGPYYVKARPANATGLAKTGSNPFYVGILLLIYGQSNALRLFDTAASAPSASAGTTWFDGSVWTTVPAANGVRELLNGLIANTGIPCAAIGGGAAGTSLANLLKGAGTGYYEALLASVVASGGDAEFMVWRHGENAASGVGVNQSTYTAQFNQLHSDLAADIGRTQAQIPIIVSGLAWTSDASYDNVLWDAVQRTQLDLASQTATYYSHTNLDATLQVDELHETGSDAGNEGKRFARTISTYLGSTSGYPKFSITASATVDATTTTVDVTHDLGTDISPSSGIKGFEASGDNGSNWVSCTGVRTSATRVTLTHSSLNTDSRRKLRYLYGKNPDRSALVKDNSSLAVPLLMSAGNLSPTPLATSPVPTWRVATQTSATTATQGATGLTIGSAAARRLVIVTFTADASINALLTSATITPNVGTAKSATIAIQNTQNTTPMAGVIYALLDADADTATTVDVSFTFGANPFRSMNVNVWTVPSADLSSTTPVDAKQARASAAGSVAITNLSTSSNGFVITAAVHGILAATATYASSTETISIRSNLNVQSGDNVAGDCSGNAAHTGDFTVQANFPAGNDNCGVVAVSWR